MTEEPTLYGDAVERAGVGSQRELWYDTSQPDDAKSAGPEGEDCFELVRPQQQTAFKLNDASCAVMFSYVCEREIR